jgi:hypothetical protein
VAGRWPSHLIVTSAGDHKSADPLVMDELYASGREAIINAFKHAAAHTVHVSVRYDKKGWPWSWRMTEKGRSGGAARGWHTGALWLAWHA